MNRTDGTHKSASSLPANYSPIVDSYEKELDSKRNEWQRLHSLKSLFKY